MQEGSVRVEVGDQVEAGQVLGLVGNTGNTAAPHLHFHVMDSPSPFGSSGLPYTFQQFNVFGRVISNDHYWKASVDRDQRLPLEVTADTEARDAVGPRSDSYPLNLVIVELIPFNNTQGQTEGGETVIEVAEDFNSAAATLLSILSCTMAAAYASVLAAL